jgi:hypothetical protein
VVHEVRWGDALPWWLLFRAAGAAFAPTVILLAAAGALATWAGWSMADRLGLAGVDPAADVIAAAKADDLLLPGAAPGTSRPFGRPGWLRSLGDRLPAVVTDLTRLVAIPFRPTATLRELGGAAARIGWFLLVWSIFGTAIARHVALKLVGEDAPGVVGATWPSTRCSSCWSACSP